jgi:hypothetical protein
MSDHTSTYATVNLTELLNELKGMEVTSHKSIKGKTERRLNSDKQSEMKVA